MISKKTSAVDLNVDGLGDALGVRPWAGGLARCSSIQLVCSLLTNGVAQLCCERFVLELLLYLGGFSLFNTKSWKHLGGFSK